jgi:hypothetical protein
MNTSINIATVCKWIVIAAVIYGLWTAAGSPDILAAILRSAH